MAKRTGAKLEAAIVRAYRNGEGGVRVAHRLGVGVSSVYHVLSRHGVKRRLRSARPRKLSPAEERRLTQRYVKGEQSASLAAAFNCSQWLVRTVARRNGGFRRKRGGPIRRWTSRQQAAIVRRYERGESQQDIAAHYGASQIAVSRLLRAAGVAHGPRSGERHGMWRGGRVRMGEYVCLRVAGDHPYAAMRNSTGYVLEHRLVMAQQLGRVLTSRETVHHINGVKDDNRPENLQIRRGKHGNGQAYVCGDCGSHNVVQLALG